MKWSKYFLISVFAMLYIPLSLAQSLEGKWTTIDDRTGKKRALVQLELQNGTLNGTILKVYHQKDDTGICSKCPGAFKDKPIQGIHFVWGLKEKKHGTWDDGRILDPKSGKVYRVKMTAKGDKLYVRGYVGTSLLGRTQIWLRNS